MLHTKSEIVHIAIYTVILYVSQTKFVCIAKWVIIRRFRFIVTKLKGFIIPSLITIDFDFQFNVHYSKYLKSQNLIENIKKSSVFSRTLITKRNTEKRLERDNIQLRILQKLRKKEKCNKFIEKKKLLPTSITFNVYIFEDISSILITNFKVIITVPTEGMCDCTGQPEYIPELSDLNMGDEVNAPYIQNKQLIIDYCYTETRNHLNILNALKIKLHVFEYSNLQFIELNISKYSLH
ncbi:hypothetical protein AGLY_000471 [Aphis glycines]|uniref:Uncharacterized protein n=1 Tax=Aphis glycines TaxID=307491 RepID=A0A6G0U730_APHGL|nr:hypothetical protein AGLY_000471 [Aphis glycines]